MLPGWYGLGSALHAFAAREEDGWTQLREMYQQWTFFRGTVDNAALAITKADMGIARCYAGLMADVSVRQSIWSELSREYDSTHSAIMRLTGADALLADTPWLQRSIEDRNPCVDPLNIIQVALLQEMRGTAQDGGSSASEQLRDALRLSIQGISAGMRNTG